MTRILIFLLLFLQFGKPAGLTDKPELPNIVFILADDIGPGDIGYYHRLRTGEEVVVQTPNLDNLALAGIRFSDAHSSTALCSPTRYSIITGNYAFRCYEPWGVWDPFLKSAIGAGEETIAEVARAGGYKTAFFGKWHLGGDWKEKASNKIFRSYPFAPEENVDITEKVGSGPNEFGFDYSFSLPNGIQNVPYAMYENGKWVPMNDDSFITPLKKSETGGKRSGQGDSNWDPSKIGPILAQRAQNYILNSEEPFFLYYCSQAVHHPHRPPLSFNGTQLAGAYPSDYLAMVKEMDIQVGIIIDALKAKGIYDNTLLIFTSDNGGMGLKEMLINGHDPSNGFRDFKGSVYEGGHRVPFFAVWPNKIRSGITSDELIVTHDLMATIYELTGQSIPYDQAKDSKSILPLLLEEKGAKGHELLIQQGGNDSQVAIRKGKWKLIMLTEKSPGAFLEPVALFNIRENPFEKEELNLIGKLQYKGMVNDLKEEYIGITTSTTRTTVL